MLQSALTRSSDGDDPIVLVVDDDDLFHRTVERALEPDRVPLLHAFSGAAGLKLALEAKPTVVLLDLKMPDIGGIEILDAFYAAASESRVIIVTGHLKAADTKDLEGRVNDIYLKHEPLERLQAYVRRALIVGFSPRTIYELKQIIRKQGEEIDAMKRRQWVSPLVRVAQLVAVTLLAILMQRSGIEVNSWLQLAQLVAILLPLDQAYSVLFKRNGVEAKVEMNNGKK